MKQILVIMTLLTASCSTLHIHKGFYLNRAGTNAAAKSACENATGEYGEPILLKIDDHEFRIFAWYKMGLSFIGPVFMPVIPVFWTSLRIDSLGIKIIPEEGSSSSTQLDLSKLFIVMDDGTKVFPKASQIETLDNGVTIRNIGGGDWLVFEFPRRSVPGEFTLYAPRTAGNQNDPELQKISFKRHNRWHYVPIIIMHSEWPYTHDLPCKRAELRP